MNLTHGEKRLTRAFKRLQGYAKTRGFLLGLPRAIGSDQFECWAVDTFGNEAPIAFHMRADECTLLDEYGRKLDCVASEFELQLSSLRRKLPVDKRQLLLELDA